MDRSRGLVRRGQQKFNLPLKRMRQWQDYWTIAWPVSELKDVARHERENEIQIVQSCQRRNVSKSLARIKPEEDH
jgi:hypothetical protein